jgi:hypothetical protein
MGDHNRGAGKRRHLSAAGGRAAAGGGSVGGGNRQAVAATAGGDAISAKIIWRYLRCGEKPALLKALCVLLRLEKSGVAPDMTAHAAGGSTLPLAIHSQNAAARQQA